MKVFVATTETQGARWYDVMNCEQGELVWLIVPCSLSLEDADGECKCGRSFAGMTASRLTSTVEVRDLNTLTRRAYSQALRSALEATGWNVRYCDRPIPEMVDELLAKADAFPEGAIVERCLDDLTMRSLRF